jgi:hypothetical protein
MTSPGRDVARSGAQSERRELRGARFDGRANHLRHRLLPGTWGLPDLSHVVPDVVGIHAPGDVAGPRPDKVGPCHGETQYVAPAPVVADEIDGPLDPFEFFNQPLQVSVRTRVEAGGHRGPEAGRREDDDVLPSQACD